MRKNRRTLVVVLLFLALVSLAWMLLTPRAPKYQGRSLNSWLAQLDDGDHDGGWEWSPWSRHTNGSKSQAAAAEAIRQMGTNIIPFLIAEISKNEPTILIKLENLLRRQKLFSTSWLSNKIEQEKLLRHQAALALDALGPAAKPALPHLLKVFYTNEHAKQATIPLAGIGPEGWIELTRAITNSNETLVINGIWGMGMHGAAVPGTVDHLLIALTNQAYSGGVGPISAWALGEIKQNPERVVPALITALQSGSADMRWSAAVSLSKFGSEASNAIPILRKALEDPDSTVRNNATNALKTITGTSP